MIIAYELLIPFNDDIHIWKIYESGLFVVGNGEAVSNEMLSLLDAPAQSKR